MFVKCEKCGQSYEIDTSRIKAKAARIKCPSCKNMFLLHGDGRVTALDSKADSVNAEAGSDPAKIIAGAEGTVWKVRHIGLTYTFHDLDGLRDWLSGRASLDGVKIAKDEDEWRELGDYKEVLTTEMIAKFFPLGDVPTTQSKPRENAPSDDGASVARPGAGTPAQVAPMAVSNVLAPNEENASYKKSRKAQQERKKARQAQQVQIRRLTIAAVAIVVVVVAGLFAYRHYSSESGFSGVIADTGSNDETVSEPAPVPEKPSDPGAAPDDTTRTDATADDGEKTEGGIEVDDIDVLAELELQTQISEAEDLVNKKMYPEARATLESLRKDMPNHPDVLRLLSRTYKGLGLDAKATEIDAQIEKHDKEQEP